ncbi:MAG: hypothetical protein QM582_11690, partial [Micropruina sp.]|uniref:hypothetical protein n=1 Tax=Micropruina sp. TaxID=2737536 RepID=UPI0039E3FF7B
QLSRPRRTAAPAPDLHWAAGTAALQVGCWLAGGLPDALGSVLIPDADRALRVRPLRAHPGCACRTPR